MMEVTKKNIFTFISLFGLMSFVYVLFRGSNGATEIHLQDIIAGLPTPSRLTIGKFRNITAKRWIVVTTISSPTPDVQFLAKLTGWRVVVVGDTKTPKNWSFPNCVYLSIEDQLGLGFQSVFHVPEKSYSRKNIGYLFAIAHGAEIIYETDDDNRPTDMLTTFVLNSTMFSIAFTGHGLFNPYRHFGQPTLWPRGYPLSAVGENFTTNYEVNHFKTPSIQQGIVNGDPDMDAIFRLTRKKTTSVLNVTFDGRAPPAIVPWGVFSPFNSQNTLFLYDALWAMMIPTTTAFRVCDIWRGYWAQRLLWEMGGNLGFFPPNAYQKRNSHSYLLDAMDEKDLYFKTESLITFLKNWICKSELTFFGCVVQLSIEMAEHKFWKEGDSRLAISWVSDLKSIGYKEPVRVDHKAFVQRVLTVQSGKLPNQDQVWNDGANVTFWAVEQRSPLQYSRDKIRPMLPHILQISEYCNNSFANMSLLTPNASVVTFPNILLIVVFNFPHYQNVQFVEAMYALHFPHIAYCGINKEKFENQTKSFKHLTFIEAHVNGGWLAQNCMSKALKMHYDVDGYLYIGDDTLLNVWNINSLPMEHFWFQQDLVLRESQNTSWHWWNNVMVGRKRYLEAKQATVGLDKARFNKFFQMLARNTGFPDGLNKGASDIAFVPRRFKQDVIYFLEHFTKFNLFVEIAIPTVFWGLEEKEKVYNLKGRYLWYDGKREHIETHFNETHHFMHPVKIGKELLTEKGRQFYCSKYFPLTFKK